MRDILVRYGPEKFMKLTHEQRLKVFEWAAELLRLDEINVRAAKFDPPFQVEYLQLKWARRRGGVRFRQDRAKADQEAIERGVAVVEAELLERAAKKARLEAETGRR